MQSSVDQQVAGLRFAHSFFEVLLFDALASAVSDELRNQSRDYCRSDDAQDSARHDRGSNTKKRGDDSGFRVAEFWSRGVADHLQPGKSPAQVMWNRLTPNRHSKTSANNIEPAGQTETAQSQIEILRQTEKNYCHAPERGRNRD